MRNNRGNLENGQIIDSVESEVSKHEGVEKLRQPIRRRSWRFCKCNTPYTEEPQNTPFGHMVSEGEESIDRNEPKTLKITESDKSST